MSKIVIPKFIHKSFLFYIENSTKFQNSTKFHCLSTYLSHRYVKKTSINELYVKIIVSNFFTYISTMIVVLYAWFYLLYHQLFD